MSEHADGGPGAAFTHCHKVRVRYAETDAMGVVYYGNYLTFFEVARVEYLRAAGIDYRSLEDAKMTGAVTTAHINYHLPSRFDDELSLYSRCVSMGKVRFRIEYEVWREEDGALLASGYTEHALLSHTTLRPVRIPEWVREGVEQFEGRRLLAKESAVRSHQPSGVSDQQRLPEIRNPKPETPSSTQHPAPSTRERSERGG